VNNRLHEDYQYDMSRIFWRLSLIAPGEAMAISEAQLRLMAKASTSRQKDKFTHGPVRLTLRRGRTAVLRTSCSTTVVSVLAKITQLTHHEKNKTTFLLR
jgi:hypothetical protein